MARAFYSLSQARRDGHFSWVLRIATGGNIEAIVRFTGNI